MKEDDGTFGEYRWASASPAPLSSLPWGHYTASPENRTRPGTSLPGDSDFLKYSLRSTSTCKYLRYASQLKYSHFLKEQISILVIGLEMEWPALGNIIQRPLLYGSTSQSCCGTIRVQKNTTDPANLHCKANYTCHFLNSAMKNQCYSFKSWIWDLFFPNRYLQLCLLIMKLWLICFRGC